MRFDDDPALAIARYVQAAVVRQALEDGYDVGVTTSQRNRVEHWRRFADDAGTAFLVRTVDPGRDVVRERLSEPDGSLSDACARAIRRWYG